MPRRPSPRQTPRPWLRLTLAAVAALSLLTASCSSTGESLDSQRAPTDESLPEDGAPQDGGTLVVGVYQETSGWNPTYDRWAQMGALVGSTVLEPLTVLDDQGRAQPWLATAWRSDPTFKTWTITLRPGVRFHDGTAFDADAVVANVEDQVKGVLSGLLMSKLIAGAHAVDASTVQIDLLTPWAAFPEAYMASQTSMMRSPKTMTETNPGSAHPVGTGPYVFKDWTRDDTFAVERNPSYWRAGEPHLDRLEFRVITEDSARATALRASDIDMMFTLSAKDVAELDGDFTVVRDWDTEQTMMIANTRPMVGDHVNPMANIHGRRAIAMATDRQYLADLVGQGLQLYSAPFSPDSPWGLPEAQAGYPAFDQDGARKEVAAYLADTGQSSMEIQLLGIADTNSSGVLQALQAQWAEVGITSSVRTADATSLIQGMIGSVYDLVVTSIYSAPDPDQDFVFWSREYVADYGKLSINFSGYSSDAIEALIARSRSTGDQATRHDLLDQIVKEHNAQLTSIWMYATPFSLVAAPRVHGLKAIADEPFANYQPKTWWGRIWLSR